MKENSCIFCKLANGEIPSDMIYEDERFGVILDAAPATKGHALILPKEHYADLYEIDEETAGEAMKLAKRLAGPMTQALRCDGLNLVQNNKETAGQTVFHFHMHLIPRYRSENNDKILTWSHQSFTEEERKEICKTIKEGLY